MISLPEMKKKQIVFVFANEGEKLSFSNDNIIVRYKDGKIKHQSTCYKLFMVIVAGNISVTSGLIQRAKRFGFTICLMTQTMKVYQVISNGGEGNTLLRKKQYEYEGLELGKRIIHNKIENQQLALKRIREKSSFDREAIQHLEDYMIKLEFSESINEIMGYEGAAARVYFERLFCQAEWKGRKPRIKSDYINSTLDVGYNILFNYVDALLTSFGFDTYYGVLHRCFYRRKSLVCDIVEPFRPIIDYEIRKGINLGQIDKDDFQQINYQYLLKWEASPKYVRLFIKAIQTHKEDIFLYIQQYYRSFAKSLEPDKFPRYEF